MVVLSAVGLSRNNPVPIQEVDLDIFSSLESIDTLGLKQSLQEGLAGVKSLQLRGQYRFWEGALELDVFDSLTDLTLTDCTMLYETLQKFTGSKKHQLRTLTLVAVGLLPYSQLGYLRWSGTLIDAIPWLLEIPSLAAVPILDGSAPPSADRNKSFFGRRPAHDDREIGSAFLAVACMQFPFLFYKYGPVIRRKCKYAAESDDFMRKLMEQSTRAPEETTETEKEAEAAETLAPTAATGSTSTTNSEVDDLPSSGQFHWTRSMASQASYRSDGVTSQTVYDANPYDIDRVNTRESFKK
ncbi:hypothetical protein FE257_002822 [Aspergillus nanangensis]|uniref:Uncharacterized protein n=1 Tax=Aspergillus nanangensis TaxID=2582783 RepID=A0AAD4CC53_ASPNN|nr:hypothetical protein FE257_002822 [Aspergillus nanangensis]